MQRWTRGQREGRGVGQTGRLGFTLPYVKQIASGKLLQSTGSSTWYFLMTQRGGVRRGDGNSLKREGTYVYTQLIHFVVQQKLTQHCRATIQQFFKKIQQYRHVIQTFECKYHNSQLKDLKAVTHGNGGRRVILEERQVQRSHFSLKSL